MGRTRQSRDVSNRMTQNADRVNQQYDTYNARFPGLIDSARTRATDLYNQTLGNYTDFLNASKGFGHPEGYYDPSAENVNRMRGGGVFDEFAKTGGMSDSARQDFRSRATSSIPSFYTGLQNELTRARARSGGVDPGFDAQTAALARQQSQATSQASTSAEVDLNNIINQGRQWGAGSMSDAERAVVDAIQRGRMFGSTENQNIHGQQLQAMHGLSDLYSATPGELAMYEGLYQRGLGQGDAARSGAIGQLADYTPSGNWFDRNRRLLGIVGGVASAFMPWLAPTAAAVASGNDSGTRASSAGFGGGAGNYSSRPVRYYDPYFDQGGYGAAGAPPPGSGGQYG